MAKGHSFDVLIISPEKVIYEGPAQNLVLPGEKGVFEVLPYHKRLLSRLISGYLVLNGHPLAIRRGLAKVELERTVVIVEEDKTRS